MALPVLPPLLGPICPNDGREAFLSIPMQLSALVPLLCPIRPNDGREVSVPVELSVLPPLVGPIRPNHGREVFLAVLDPVAFFDLDFPHTGVVPFTIDSLPRGA